LESDNTEAEIRAAEHAWMEAMQARDAGRCAAYMAEEYILISAQSVIVRRATWLENVQHMTFHTYAFGRMEIAVTGEVALVRAPWRQEATNRGQPWNLDGEIVDVWSRREGRWLVVIRWARGTMG
jgi:ketosteroid isomerase-like protein